MADAPKDISSVVNGMFFGFVVAVVLQGVILTQGWVYMNSNHDKWYLRLFVALIVVLDFADTCCRTATLHHYLISNSGNTAALRTTARIIDVGYILNGITFLFVHLFFAIQLLKFSKSWWLPTLIMIFSTVMLVVNVHSVSGPLPLLNDVRPTRIRVEVTMFHGLAVATDVMVTLSLSWYLHSRKGEMKNTRLTIQRLVAYIMTRGILITAVQIAHVIMYAIDPSDWLFWISTHVILSKLYATTMLFILNARRSLRARMDRAMELGSLHFSTGTLEISEATSPWLNSPPVSKLSQVDTENSREDRGAPSIPPDHSV